MTQLVRILLAAGVAIVSICLTAAAAHAEPEPADDGLVTDAAAPFRIFDREINTLLLPQLRKPEPSATTRRPPRATTLLQVDAPLGGDSDLMFRVQAKQKQFLFLELRF